jgi:hypothetical protein
MPTSTLSLSRLAIDTVRADVAGAVAEVAQIELTDVRLATDAGKLRGLRAKRARLKGVTLSASAAAIPPLPPRRPGATWFLAPLATLQGRLEAFITDAHWIVDADVTVPIEDGRVEFSRVTVEHVGPDSTMGASHLGIHVDAPNGRNYLFRFAASHVPGVRFEQRRGSLFGSRVADRGALDIAPFVQALLAGHVLGDAPHPVEAQLDRTRLSGTLHLGDGELGTPDHHLVLAGRAQGRNRLTVSAAVVGQEIAAKLPELHADRAAFRLLGQAGRCGAVRGAVTVQMRRQALSLQADELSVDDVLLGDVATA